MEHVNCDSKFLNLCRKAGSPVQIVTNLPDPDTGGPLHILARVEAFNSEYVIIQDVENPKISSLLSREFIGMVTLQDTSE